MSVRQRLVKAVHSFDGDRDFGPNELSGILEVTTNSSPSTVKTFPRNVDTINSDIFASGDGIELIVYNTSANDFALAANTGDSSFIVGNTTVPAGSFRLVNIAVNYNSGALGIFCI